MSPEQPEEHFLKTLLCITSVRDLEAVAKRGTEDESGSYKLLCTNELFV